MRRMYKGREIRPSVEIYHDAIAYLGGVTLREFFMNKVLCARAWREGTGKIRDYFGDMLPLRPVSGPPLSYGHVACLGAGVVFPEDSEPNVKPMFADIDEGIQWLRAKETVDYAGQPLFRHYLELCGYLNDHFPEPVPFSGLGSQGPLTTAVLLRGQDFLLDIYDEPEKAKAFLALICDSIVGFRRFISRINKSPEISPEGAGLADDFASLIAPGMWSEFVIPYWKRFYEGLTTGKRSLHCENLAPAHLIYLKEAEITHFQPSVSDLLTIDNIKASTDVPFDWLLYAYRITDMNDAEIESWVDHTVAAGISSIRTQFGRFTIEADRLDRIKAFIRAFDKYQV